MKKKAPKAREVCFNLFRYGEAVCEGRFTVTKNREVSCFGRYRDIKVPEGDRVPAIYEGVVIEHNLNDDGSASILIKYYGVKESEANAFGHEQVLEITAGLAMGSESGAEKSETIMLSENHELVFRTHLYA